MGLQHSIQGNVLLVTRGRQIISRLSTHLSREFDDERQLVPSDEGFDLLGGGFCCEVRHLQLGLVKLAKQQEPIITKNLYEAGETIKSLLNR